MKTITQAHLDEIEAVADKLTATETKCGMAAGIVLIAVCYSLKAAETGRTDALMKLLYASKAVMDSETLSVSMNLREYDKEG